MQREIAAPDRSSEEHGTSSRSEEQTPSGSARPHTALTHHPQRHQVTEGEPRENRAESQGETVSHRGDSRAPTSGPSRWAGNQRNTRQLTLGPPRGTTQCRLVPGGGDRRTQPPNLQGQWRKITVAFLNMGGGIVNKAERLRDWLTVDRGTTEAQNGGTVRNRPDIIALAETGFTRPAQRARIAEQLTDDAWSMFHDPEWQSGEQDPTDHFYLQSQGVGLLVRKDVAMEVQPFKTDSPGILWACVRHERESPPVIVGVVYVPVDGSLRPDAQQRRADLWHAMTADIEQIQSQHRHSPALLVGDFNSSPETMAAWLAGEGNRWKLIPNTAPTFIGPSRTTIDYALYADPIFRGEELSTPFCRNPRLSVQTPRPGLSGRIQYHMALLIEVRLRTRQRRFRRGQMPPRSNRDGSNGGGDHIDSSDDEDEEGLRIPRPATVKKRNSPQPATPGVNDPNASDAHTCLAQEILRRFDNDPFITATKVNGEWPSPEALDATVARFTEWMYQSAVQAYGLHPADLEWVREAKLAPKGRKPTSLPDEWLEMARCRWQLLNIRVSRTLTPSDLHELRSARAHLARQMTAVWRKALKRDIDLERSQLIHQRPRQQWRTLDRLAALDDAVIATNAGSTNATKHSDSVSGDDPRLVSKERKAHNAAGRFRNAWQQRFGQVPEILRARPLDEADKAVLPQMKETFDINPLSASDWKMLESYVVHAIPKQRTDAAVSDDKFHISWRKCLYDRLKDGPLVFKFRAESGDEDEDDDAPGDAGEESPATDSQQPPIGKQAAEIFDSFVTGIVMASVHNGHLPKQWNRRFLSPVRKSGKPLPSQAQRDNPASFRPIAWGSRLASLALSALQHWLTHIAETHKLISPMQLGFRSYVGGPAALPLYILHTAAMRIAVHTAPTYVCSIDLAGAYDTVDQESLREILTWMRFGPRIVELLMDSLRAELSVLVRDRVAEGIQQRRGVAQGHPIAPLLFILFAERVLRGVTAEIHRVGQLRHQHDSGARLRGPKLLAYADDMTCLAGSPTELQETLDILAKWIDKAGLEINPSKTQVCVFGRKLLNRDQRHCNISLKGKEAANVDELTVLGIPLHADLDFSGAQTRMATTLRRALGWTRRTAVDGRTPARLAATVFQARGVGTVTHQLPLLAPAVNPETCDQPLWKPEAALRMAAKSLLRLPPQTSTNWAYWETQWLSMWERAMRARDNIFRDTLHAPQRAVLARMVVQQQKQLSLTSFHETELPSTNRLQHKRARIILRFFPELLKLKDLLDCDHGDRIIHRQLLMRRWEAWWQASNATGEFTRSPLRYLHSPLQATDDLVPAEPKWTKYAPGNEGSRLLAQLRSGSCRALRDTEWSVCRQRNPETAPPDRHCPHCGVPDNVTHLAVCEAPNRQTQRQSFLHRWTHELGIGTPSTDEVLAILVGEAPHHCTYLQMDDARKAAWKKIFHAPVHVKRWYFADLTSTLRRILTTETPTQIGPMDTFIQGSTNSS